jgi:hypothetical protein
MVKLNLGKVKPVQKLPKGMYNVAIVEVKDTFSDGGKAMLSIRHDVIDNGEFYASPIYKNFTFDEKSLPYLVDYLKAVGLSDAEIAEIEDSKKIEKAIVGLKLTVNYKPSTDYAFGTMSNPRPYEP